MASSSVIITTAARGAILWLALIVFLGNIMMWIIMPTDTYYNDWLLHILADTNSTFFGIQGPIMLNFTFPILFIAVVGCLYLHLGKIKKSSGCATTSKSNTKVSLLKKPMIVKGLGIVTITELALFILFVALCVWYFAYYVRHWFKQVPMLSMTRHEKTWQTKLDRVAIVTGVTGNLCLTFLFYPVTRKSSILPMIGLTSEASIKYHIWLGHMTMALFTAHGFLYIVYWALTNRISEMIKWNDHYVSNIAGEISLLCGLALWLTTYPNIRRKMFELFFYTHHLYIAFIIFFILHAGIGFACIMLPGFYLFVIDRYLRFLQSRQNVRLVSARVLPCETVELNFAKCRGLTYNPTSTMFINLPIISKLQWHPFTITSNSSLEPERLSIVVKCEGSWTKKLYDSLSSPSSVNRLQVSVEGPYGPDTTNFLRHDMLVMISGGSGITPFISIIRELMFISSTTQSCKIPKLMLISVFKSTSHLSMLDLIPPISHTNSRNLGLQIEAYVTREKSQPTEKPQPIRTVQFRPSPSDAPIFQTLGPNTWLWLSTIISSSFVVFLVLLGTFTQYVVYPIDKNTNLLYSYTKKNSMNIFLICVSIVATASIVFLWNKNRNAKEDKQIQDMERIGNTFGSSDDDVELQSLPLQSVIKSINVHYGKRPDLKRILMENKESTSNVGVLVSGPWEMRKDVAGICSSGPADNIHFESISFSWDNFIPDFKCHFSFLGGWLVLVLSKLETAGGGGGGRRGVLLFCASPPSEAYDTSVGSDFITGIILSLISNAIFLFSAAGLYLCWVSWKRRAGLAVADEGFSFCASPPSEAYDTSAG
ncbi:Ferric reduction oxidase 2 [Striga hermonthica]|uniref:Ferric reduction oxidase 2 n=1 Tax=Striga hermonthica TaxID=68872 RepID=A0A9N7MV90_STRHE|nr:Ferric reduction oxidase 2 [Striga hermonthica]